MFVDIINSADTGMVQGAGGASFPAKPFDRESVRSKSVREEFQRDFASETLILGVVNDSHASAANLFEDHVMGDGGADHWRTAPWLRAGTLGTRRKHTLLYPRRCVNRAEPTADGNIRNQTHAV
jgi:hypothetical protein